MSLGMGMQLVMAPQQELKQTLLCKCEICKTKEELGEVNNRHNDCLGVDPEQAMKNGLCPKCYTDVVATWSVASARRAADWIVAELKKKVPAWREPHIPQDLEPFRSIPWRLSFYNRKLEHEYHRIGGCRGLLDYPSAEFQKTNVEQKKVFLKKLEEYGISPREVRSAVVRYLEVITKTPYQAACADADLGWDEVFGEGVTKKLMQQAKELRDLDE